VKRHPAFQDLSRDHYTALNRSLQVVRAVEGHPRARPYEHALANFEALWLHDGLQAHFGEEEHDLLPVLNARSEAAMAERLLREHAALRDAFAAIVAKTATPERAAQAARDLMAHARWEEETVFEWLQDHLGEAELQDLLTRGQSFRRQNGLPVGPPR
jgi:hypothetical protein